VRADGPHEASPHIPLSLPGSTGQPGKPLLLDPITGVFGILDHPLARVMTSEIVIASEAKQSIFSFSLQHGLLRCARNDVET
jgi:hypothetical protein